MRHLRFLLVILLLVLSSCLWAAIPRYSTDPNDFVQARLGHFWVNGEPFRFTGYNVRGLAHYGEHDILGGSSTADRDVNMAYMEDVGARVARIFVSCKFADRYSTGNRLDAALAAAAAHNVYVIVAFTDEYRSGFCPMGDMIDYGNQQYYNYGSGNLLNADWFNGAYNLNYRPQVEYLVNIFKNDPAVFAWQLGNELKCHWNPTDLLPFSHDMATRIRAIDSRHMVSHGTAGRVFSFLNWDQGIQLYQDFDFLTTHTYNGSDTNDDTSLAAALGKPLLVAEAGMSSDNYTPAQRPVATDNDIAKWISRGARGYMNWGLMATSYDNGDGDFLYGIDYVCLWKKHEQDFAAYTQVYSKWSGILATTVWPAPEIPTGVQASDGIYPDRVVVSWNPAFAAAEYAVYRGEQASAAPTPAAPVNLLLNSTNYIECGHNLETQSGASLVDGNLSTKWCCFHSGISTPGDHWIAFDLGSTATVNSYIVRHASTGGESTSYNTKTFYIESAPSMNGPWTQEVYINNASAVATNTLTYSTPKALRYIRLRITKPNFLSYDYAVRIPEFEVWGTPGSDLQTQISPWQSATSFTDTTALPGVTYTYSVKARNQGGESSLSVSDTGYLANLTPVTIIQAKGMADGTLVYITGGAVSATFNAEFYIQQGMLGGISVQWNGTVTEGSVVDVIGTIATTSAGQRRIVASSVTVQP